MRTVVCAVLVIVVPGLCGCGSSRIELFGDVTLDEKPLERGSILLIPLDQSTGTSTGGEIRDGRYALTGTQAPQPGHYKVEIRAAKKSGRRVQKSMGKPGELEDELVEAVASRFNSQTTLTVEVKPGSPAHFAVASK